MHTFTLTKRAQAMAAVLSFVLGTALTACGGGGDKHPADTPGAPVADADVTTAVTPAAATNPAVATSYTSSLAATPESKSDGLEPVVVPDALATDDGAEPAA